jgi:hypothetical protein
VGSTLDVPSTVPSLVTTIEDTKTRGAATLHPAVESPISDSREAGLAEREHGARQQLQFDLLM